MSCRCGNRITPHTPHFTRVHATCGMAQPHAYSIHTHLASGLLELRHSDANHEHTTSGHGGGFLSQRNVQWSTLRSSGNRHWCRPHEGGSGEPREFKREKQQARYVNGSGSAGGLSKMRRSVTHRAAQLGDDSMIAQLCFAPDGMLFPRSLDPTTQQFRTRAVARVFRHQALPSHHRGHLQCTGDAIDPFTRGSGSGGHQPV